MYDSFWIWILILANPLLLQGMEIVQTMNSDPGLAVGKLMLWVMLFVTSCPGPVMYSKWNCSNSGLHSDLSIAVY